MPTYQYRCSNCGNELEIVQKISDASLTLCPKCETESFERVISASGGFLLKGSGFYKTDYGSGKPAPAAPTPSPCSTGACSGGGCPLAK
ncbi:FmdB family zinc ribbon protein [Pelodictyon phaeoclathratiforme]|jgi:putative FmdB family regulatory protein|uniref:Regulatory protein, FmdB family n=1 Tax=Pelodictyon phaeoclathratiforme (strain DSM 5477 / BU-1) TaxID=324925 RepID=B4SGV9_PELPB|nr:zinc ribbon domain-containing protein [Pelodictyon phaeoclathratiforme]ACF44947.1 regulatory protein, FmdB family [Pelodictyon phaeoclathratiforme BU-1]MBV5288703.1 zinc ribbon domain-containing protein [Pelodictyon phaeoclathratiforme]